VSVSVTIINEVFTVACAPVEYAVITGDKITFTISPSSLILTGTQVQQRRGRNRYTFGFCTTDISRHGKYVNDCPVQVAETTPIDFNVLTSLKN